MEETLNSKRVGPTHERVEHKRQHDSSQRQEAPQNKQRLETPLSSFTKLNTSRVNIVMEIKAMKEFQWPPRIKSPPETRDRNKYCDFHRDHGHITENRIALKWEIEALVGKGLLGSYVSSNKRPRNDREKEKAPETRDSRKLIVGTINIIVGGIASGGDSNKGRKQCARQQSSAFGVIDDRLEDITFGTKDMDGVSLLHDDALFISTIIANFEGFGGGVIVPEGVIELSLTLGIDPKQVTEVIPFQVVHASMAYNAILGRPLLNKIREIVSTFHIFMKFSSGHGIGVVHGDQKAARQCYITSLREAGSDVMQLSDDEPDPDHRGRLSPVEELMEVELEVGEKVEHWSRP
ncbi:uncharacterized protein LOC111399956 [Olea europaea var. sylvestris]|uniref:uncharacterized protein LOC111399956 n=1 Tax=Olea europaea var. sylvestris TaxID=158386 RepID=UPI000C1CDCB7|nr:uncharacterized protein LOC111399956 [Olea europaea var. sylvestris]